MTAPPRLFGSQVVLLIAVVTPLAVAEGVWFYWGLTLVASGLGWWFVVRRHLILLGPGASRALAVAAFLFLILEYAWLNAIPVVALSHFMILVCACKLLGHQTLRDQSQVFVLCLLLLVVAAIVSGNILFPAVLLVYLGVAFTRSSGSISRWS